MHRKNFHSVKHGGKVKKEKNLSREMAKTQKHEFCE